MADPKSKQAAPPPPPSRETLERQLRILREIGASQETLRVAEKAVKTA